MAGALLGATTVLGLLPGSPATAATPDGVWDYERVSITGDYEPFAGSFGGDRAGDVFWYAPGPEPDTLWIGSEGRRTASRQRYDVDGAYQPVVGDFAGDERDDILWYAPGVDADPLWVADGSADVFDRSGSLTVDGEYETIRVLRDERAGRKDRVMWWDSHGGNGSRDMSVWVFETDGTHRFFRSRNGTAQQVVAGDWNADGVDDLVFYAQGLTEDEVWTSHPNSFSRQEVDIFARYRLVTVRGTDRDHVLMFGVENRRDVYWRSSPTGFHSQDMTIDSGGSPFAAGPSAAVIYNAEGPEKAVLDSGTAAVVVDLSPTRDIGDDRELVVSDLDGDGRTDLIWYGPGEGPDAIWYGHRAGA